jgi:hypothetical protein
MLDMASWLLPARVLVEYDREGRTKPDTESAKVCKGQPSGAMDVAIALHMMARMLADNTVYVLDNRKDVKATEGEMQSFMVSVDRTVCFCFRRLVQGGEATSDAGKSASR